MAPRTKTTAVRQRVYSVRLAPSVVEQVNAAAEAEGMTPSEWIRRKIVGAIRRRRYADT